MNLDFHLHDRQGAALQSQATEILYGGAAGGGKSHLMRVMSIIMCCMIPDLQIYLFRRNYNDLTANHMVGPTSYPALLDGMCKAGKCKINYSSNTIKFWNGANIKLCHLQYEKDIYTYQGAEIHVLLMDELTHFTETMYRFLRNRVRLGALKVPENFFRPLPLIFCGSNPGGVGHNWVKRTFVTAAPPMKIVKQDKREGGMARQYIPAKMTDNPTLMENDPDYGDRLEGLGDPALVAAMKEGDWDIVAGGALDDVWSTKCILPRMRIPKGWTIERSLDWGSTHPFSVGIWAIANGASLTDDEGNEYFIPRGSIIRIAEWYGCSEKEANRGIKLSAAEVAQGVLRLQENLQTGGWIQSNVNPGPADSQIYACKEKDVETIAKKMEDEGVTWVKADKSQGSRINGLELFRQLLKNVKMDETEKPGIYFMENCPAAINTLPVLPRDKNNTEDVDTNSEDHVYDDCRYMVLRGINRYTTKLKINMGR
ncbi:TPA: terminase family protein [Escherichia coli]|nr:terminase family protein [Escherichia coli]